MVNLLERGVGGVRLYRARGGVGRSRGRDCGAQQTAGFQNFYRKWRQGTWTATRGTPRRLAQPFPHKGFPRAFHDCSSLAVEMGCGRAGSCRDPAAPELTRRDASIPTRAANENKMKKWRMRKIARTRRTAP